MAIELKVPSLGESISEVQIGEWLKQAGDYVKRDEPLVEIESEKATVEFVAPVSGVLSDITLKTGVMAEAGDLLGLMEEQDAPAEAPATAKASAAPAKENTETEVSPSDEKRVMPAAQRALATAGLSSGDVDGTGPGGRVLKEDVEKKAAQKTARPSPTPASTGGMREQEVIPMSPMRRTIAAHLVSAQQNAALLTTFNEIDMTNAMALRKTHQEAFVARYGIKLGYMSIFVKAVVDALKQFPELNAEIQDKSIVYHNYQDISIAVGGKKGLVVPVIRNAESLGFAEIESTIKDFGVRAQANKITMEELKGGTFTISNGGIYGSMLSTPIINPPQSGILGMHAIQDRPVALNGEVVIRPIMYVALTYDHRIVDGKGAVSFLIRVKECVENPARMLLEV
jgi:2-oxoglutarate dehydrogenase E2 component (dihydrolipoamide succinyltransferase)